MSRLRVFWATQACTIPHPVPSLNANFFRSDEYWSLKEKNNKLCNFWWIHQHFVHHDFSSMLNKLYNIVNKMPWLPCEVRAAVRVLPWARQTILLHLQGWGWRRCPPSLWKLWPRHQPLERAALPRRLHRERWEEEEGGMVGWDGGQVGGCSGHPQHCCWVVSSDSVRRLHLLYAERMVLDMYCVRSHSQ